MRRELSRLGPESAHSAVTASIGHPDKGKSLVVRPRDSGTKGLSDTSIDLSVIINVIGPLTLESGLVVRVLVLFNSFLLSPPASPKFR